MDKKFYSENRQKLAAHLRGNEDAEIRSISSDSGNDRKD